MLKIKIMENKDEKASIDKKIDKKALELLRKEKEEALKTNQIIKKNERTDS